MGQLLLIVVVAVTVAAVVFGVTVLVSGRDTGLQPAEPDGRAIPLPTTRPLQESDLSDVRFDMATRGYRMAQVDQAMRRAAYDIGYKDELIGVLEAEVSALREGRTLDADALRRAREAAQAPPPPPPAAADRGKPGWTEFTRPAEDAENSDEAAAPEVAAEPAVDAAADDQATTEPVAVEPGDTRSAAEPVATSPAPDAEQAATESETADEPAAPQAAAVAEPAVTEPVAPEEPAVVAQPTPQSRAAEAMPAAAGEAAPTEAAAPASKTRATTRKATTRTSRPTKRAAASSEDAPSAKPDIEPETTAPPAEDAESARR